MKERSDVLTILYIMVNIYFCWVVTRPQGPLHHNPKEYDDVRRAGDTVSFGKLTCDVIALGGDYIHYG